jgi:hypothetical protein
LSLIILAFTFELVATIDARAWTLPPLSVCVVNRSTIVDNATVQTIVDGLQTQIEQQFRLYYYKKRDIRVSMTQAKGCWSLTIEDGPRWFRGYPASGWHWVAKSRPYAVVTTYNTMLSLIMDHELLEMLADPSARGREIVDNWVNYFYQVETNGTSVWVNDFALPPAIGGHFCGTVNYCQ